MYKENFLLFVVLFFLFPSWVWANDFRLEVIKTPSFITRGMSGIFEGRVRTLKTQTTQKLYISIYLTLKGKRITRLTQQSIVLNQIFRLFFKVPQELPLKQYEIEAVLWTILKSSTQQNDTKLNTQNNTTLNKQSPSFSNINLKEKVSSKTKQQIKSLLTQLKNGWGPDSDRKGFSKLEKKFTHQKKSHFLLPPVSSKIRSFVCSKSKTNSKNKTKKTQNKIEKLLSFNKKNSNKSQKAKNPQNPSSLSLSMKSKKNSNGLPYNENSLKTAKQDGRPLMLPPQKTRRKKKVNINQAHHANKSRFLTQDNQTYLDSQTTGGDIYMRQVFEPYLPHHQRITVLDKVLKGYRLRLRSRRKKKIFVGGSRIKQRAYFVGRIRVLLKPKQWTPIPSIAPDARILWYQTNPVVPLIFAKNEADVMFVRSKINKIMEVYLVFGTDADRFYFGGKLPIGIHSTMYSSQQRPHLSSSIRRRVFKFLYLMKIHSKMELHQILRKIVPYLRGFSTRPLRQKEKKTDIYETLLKARVGVCRHRAMLFTVTMQSLGYPVRFVSNGAHAFAEIVYPNGRWKVIDLGGGDIPNWVGQWKGQPFQPPKDPYSLNLKDIKGGVDNGIKIKKHTQFYMKNKKLYKKIRFELALKKQLMNLLHSKSLLEEKQSKKQKKKLSKKELLRREFLSALKRLMKRKKHKKSSPFILHSPLHRK